MRDEFQLVDRIEAYQASRSVRAWKRTSGQKVSWQADGDQSAMPANLVLESLCQACGWLVVLSTDGTKRAALASVATVEFHDTVRLADPLLLEATVTTMSDEMAVMSGRVTQAGRLILVADDIMCVLIDAEILDDPLDVDRVARHLTRSDAA